jgi:CHAT domain-containing protein
MLIILIGHWQKAIGRDRPRLHWCPVGVLALLPFHAAGVYYGENLECCADYVVSSYTPTLSALRTARENLPSILRRSLVLLAAGASDQTTETNFPILHSVKAEVADVARTARAADQIEVLEYGRISSATIHEVKNALPRADIVHLACHMHTGHLSHSSRHPLDFGFLLGDGKLTVSDIMDIKPLHPFLVFLSACNTAKCVEDQPDRGVNLAAAMLFSGFRHVIAHLGCVGTLAHWSDVLKLF